jgi:threonine/homoserine/homoserine lactone efflux protein
MLSEAISAVLTYAVGVGLSPIPAIAVILVLFSTRARVNGPLFLTGWMVGLATLVTIVHLVADQLGAGTGGTTDEGISWLRVLLGAVLLVAATRKWRHRPRPGEEPSLPAWMARIEGFGPAQALGVGLLLSSNPKNLALALGAGVSLAHLGVSARQAGAAIVVFVLVGSAAVIVAVMYALTGGAGARQRLDDTRAWLILHNGALMAALYLVFGALLISQGLGPRT